MLTSPELNRRRTHARYRYWQHRLYGVLVALLLVAALVVPTTGFFLNLIKSF